MVNNHVSFKKLPWRKLTKALEREWAAMDEANKEAFEAQMAASESKYELKLAAWRFNGGDAIPGIKELEARQEAKRRSRLTREAELKAWTASRVAMQKVKAWTADEDLVLLNGIRRIGRRWTLLAKLLPGRSAECIQQRGIQLCKAAKLHDAAAPRRSPGQGQCHAVGTSVPMRVGQLCSFSREGMCV
jgi:hypothetical protein